jgi:hypothetical protein
MAQEIQSSKNETSKIEVPVERKIATKKPKTTVAIPPEVIDTLQLYISKRSKANLRDQSNIIVYALITFLNKNLDEKHHLMPSDFLDQEKVLNRLQLSDKIE